MTNKQRKCREMFPFPKIHLDTNFIQNNLLNKHPLCPKIPNKERPKPFLNLFSALWGELAALWCTDLAWRGVWCNQRPGHRWRESWWRWCRGSGACTELCSPLPRGWSWFQSQFFHWLSQSLQILGIRRGLWIIRQFQNKAQRVGSSFATKLSE